MNELPLYQVDAFTNRPFAGNPAGVCLLEKPMPDDWMRSMAAEMNLSETAFLLEEADGFRLRWFTPAVEVELCGHATLASAHILWECGRLKIGQQAKFFTLSGELTAQKKGDWIELNFPINPPEPIALPDGLAEALGVKPVYTGRSRFDILVEVASSDIVRSLKPDFDALGAVQARGVIVTARDESAQYDFVSRFFAPRVGVNEDPVTGSAHCCLTPYWAQKLGKTILSAYQVSARGGELKIRLEKEQVVLGGQAVTVFAARISPQTAEGTGKVAG